MTGDLSAAVIWHDAECAAYDADLPVWRELAERAGGPVLDVGAGTGRVALDLARAGHRVTAVDHDGELVDVLRERARELPVEAVQADARDFDLGVGFDLCLLPMQTVQLLGGRKGRAAFLACARRHLRPGALLAVAIAEDLPGFVAGDGRPLPVPDVREHDGWVYCSRPVAIRNRRHRIVLERLRETVSPDGTREVAGNTVVLDRLSAARLEREAASARFEAAGRREIAATDEHVGSTVVMLRVE